MSPTPHQQQVPLSDEQSVSEAAQQRVSTFTQTFAVAACPVCAQGAHNASAIETFRIGLIVFFISFPFGYAGRRRE
jgi:hypothetical protein